MALPLRFFLQKSSPALICRSFHVSSSSLEKKNNMSSFYFEMEGYHKYGLLKDDLLIGAFNKDINEAIRRLPEELRLQRTYRAIRAQQSEISHAILPKEQWTTLDDDHNYLQPYLKEVIAEREEREEWEANH